MKPMGPIPPGFATRDAELLVGGLSASELVERAGSTPLFAYDLGMIRNRVARLRAALPAGVAIRYAIKANPFPPLLAAMAGLADGFDIASAGELARALDAGIDPAAISFAGPGKGDDELGAALQAGIVLNLESEGEAERALRFAEVAGIRPRLAVRVNPLFELRGAGMRMGGGARPFGIDEERVPALVRRLIDAGAGWHGFHVFAGSQALDAAAVGDALAASIALAGRLGDEIGTPPSHLTIGAGFGVPYFAGDPPLDVEAVGARLAMAWDERPVTLADTRIALELGRWLVGEAGVYFARIVDRKISHGRTFLILDGGMHHQLAASGNLGAVVRRNYPVAIADRFGAAPEEEVSIVGRLCTPLDRLADDVVLPRAEVGDLVAIFLAGAYGLSASPSAFLGHRLPRELLVDGVETELS